MTKNITPDPYTWKSEYELKNDRFDSQTRKFLEIINMMKQMVANGVADSGISGVFFQLTHYFERYMIQEEIYLKELGYDAIDQHLEGHRQFMDKIVAFQKGFEAGEKDFHVELYTWLEKWFDEHLMVDDRKAVEFINARQL